MLIYEFRKIFVSEITRVFAKPLKACPSETKYVSLYSFRTKPSLKKSVALRRGFTIDEQDNKGRKELTLESSTLQRDILTRSLLGVSVNPVVFASLKGLVIDRWDGQGKVECKDVGPFRCLITFELESIRDEAMSSKVLTDAFDEIRHHWGFASSLSRRVWVEVMGLPTIAWSESTFRSIARLWGKYVYSDDRTEEMQSFSVARFVIDCYQWEEIHEWIKVKVDDWEFEIFVKEFGAELYSRESHPNAAELAYMGEAESDGGSKPLSLAEETPVARPNPSAAIEDGDDGGLNNVAVNNIVDSEIIGGGINEDGAGSSTVSPAVDLGLADLPDPTSKVVNTGLQCPSPSPSKTGSCPSPHEFEPSTNSTRPHGLDTSSPHLHGTGRDRIGLSEIESENVALAGGENVPEESPKGTTQGVSDEVDGAVLDEAIRTKQLCEVGGFSFKNGESKELLTSIAGVEVGKKARPNTCSQSKKKKVVSKTTSSDSSSSSDGDMILASFLDKKNSKKLKAASNAKSPKPLKPGTNLIGRSLSAKLLSVLKSRRWILLNGKIIKKNFYCAICVMYGPYGKEEKVDFLKGLGEIKGRVDVPIFFNLKELGATESGVTNMVCNLGEIKHKAEASENWSS
ncbi:hypothetical protein PIB30_007041 [Stylosanthes scabra]|uniref:DUF4283 domain-containing protein n=1 Tax=Stylosanthes scabra TaxID=79078 RepID=A0ABU6Q4F4_9FABA|nr:hypothetical protein [Stylosanthes scabra]